jgi:hypothetical protein
LGPILRQHPDDLVVGGIPPTRRPLSLRLGAWRYTVPMLALDPLIDWDGLAVFVGLDLG